MVKNDGSNIFLEDITKSKATNKLADVFKEVEESQQPSIRKSNDKASSGLCIFVSWDLKDSSKLKFTNSNWGEIINEVLKIVINSISNNYNLSLNIWRVIGDEVVAFKFLDKKTSIVNQIDYICDLSSGINKKISKRYRGISLGFKATAWIACISSAPKQKGPTYNYMNNISLGQNREFIDFIGKDIDIGFRIAKFSQPKVLTLSLELASMLIKEEYNKTLWLSRFERLKGLLDDNPYPIIWRPFIEENDNESSFRTSFPYYYKSVNPDTNYCFDSFDDELLENHKLNSTIIERLCEDLNLQNKISSWEKERKNEAIFPHLPDIDELHCVAVCYNKKTQKILVVKRSHSRTYLPDYWEFGCTKPNARNSIKEALETDYSNEFGIDIHMVLDSSQDVPIPIAAYEIQKEQGEAIHKGFIFIATTDTEKVELKIEKYSDYRWLEKDFIDSFFENESLVVKNMKNTILKVFRYFEEEKK